MSTSKGTQAGAAPARLLFAVLALGLGVVLWWSLRPGAPAPGGAPSDTPQSLSAADSAGSDADIERALDLARAATPVQVDSVAIKNAWHDEVAGIDLSGLKPSQHAIFLRFANAERCTCGCGYTLAGCLASDMTCDVSRSSALALLDSVTTGRIRNAHGVRERPRGEGSLR
ncbi:MAG: hypothetical protein ACRENS_00360 [Candidatus Eiseniibacteriota bacterium]